MNKIFSLIAVVGVITITAASTEVSLSGTVKDGAGAAVEGASVSLSKQPSIKTTTNAQGAFSLTGTITGVIAPYAVSIRNSINAGIVGKVLQFTIAADGVRGGISIFSNSGRRVATFPLANIKAGSHLQSLPYLSAGTYIVSISIDGVTTSRRLISTGSEMYLGDIDEVEANGTGSLRNAAAAPVDTLVVSKNGYSTAKQALDSYTKSDIAVVLTKETAVECKLPTLPDPSGLTKENPKLPDPFTFFDGTKLTKKSQWECRRREILAMASKYIYGPCPPKPDEVTGTVSGSNVTINCKVGSKTASFTATISGSGDAIVLDLGTGISPSGSKRLSLGSGNDSKIKTLYGLSEINPNLAIAWMVDRVMDVL